MLRRRHAKSLCVSAALAVAVARLCGPVFVGLGRWGGGGRPSRVTARIGTGFGEGKQTVDVEVVEGSAKGRPQNLDRSIEDKILKKISSFLDMAPRDSLGDTMPLKKSMMRYMLEHDFKLPTGFIEITQQLLVAAQDAGDGEKMSGLRTIKVVATELLSMAPPLDDRIIAGLFQIKGQRASLNIMQAQAALKAAKPGSVVAWEAENAAVLLNDELTKKKLMEQQDSFIVKIYHMTNQIHGSLDAMGIDEKDQQAHPYGQRLDDIWKTIKEVGLFVDVDAATKREITRLREEKAKMDKL